MSAFEAIVIGSLGMFVVAASTALTVVATLTAVTAIRDFLRGRS